MLCVPQDRLVTAAGVLPLDVSVIPLQKILMSFVLSVRPVRVADVSHPAVSVTPLQLTQMPSVLLDRPVRAAGVWRQSASVTWTLPIQMNFAPLTMNAVNNASVSHKVVIVIQMLQIQTPSVHSINTA